MDLLGKNDRVIAKGPPRGKFLPGHNKWDPLYSVGELEPDVVLQTGFVGRTPGFWDLVHRRGYERLDNGILVRKGLDYRYDRRALEAMPPLEYDGRPVGRTNRIGGKM